MSDYQYEIEMSVRDYELDLEGIVNNSVYLNYFEHARHEFLKEAGLDFSELHKKGTDAVVARIEVDYRRSLASGDRFVIKCGLSRKGKLRLIFHQDLYKLPENTIAAQAVVTATCLVNGRPQVPDELEKALERLIPENTKGDGDKRR